MEAGKEAKRPTEIPPSVTLCPTATPPPVIRPNEIPPPVTRRPHRGKIESSEGNYVKIHMGIPEYEEILPDVTEYEEIACHRIEVVKNETDNPPIRHATSLRTEEPA